MGCSTSSRATTTRGGCTPTTTSRVQTKPKPAGAHARWQHNLGVHETGASPFSSSDPQAVLPASYRFTSGTGLDNGIHTFTNGVTLKTAGSQSVTATDTANGSVAGSESGIWVNPAATSMLVVSGIPSPQTPNTVSPLTVEARDTYGN